MAYGPKFDGSFSFCKELEADSGGAENHPQVD